MRKKVLFLLLVSFLLTGVVSAASLWGSYKGNAIVRVSVAGTQFKPSGVPAINFNGQPLLPLSVLDKAGTKYTYDKTRQTVDISQTLNRASLKSIVAEAQKHGGSNVSFELTGGVFFAVSDYVEQKGLNVNDLRAWDDFGDIYDLAKVLTDTGLDYVKVNYFSNGVKVGSLWTDSTLWSDYAKGKLTWEQLQRSWRLIGFDNYSKQEPGQPTKLTIKDIYKESVAVGYVESLDAQGNVACTGSGFQINNGPFVTNHHVVSCGGTGRIRVKIDGGIYDNGKGYYLFDNQTTDVFGVYISTSFDEHGRPTGEQPKVGFNIHDGLPEVGDKVYAIGSPKGLENTVSEGIVSGIRTIDGMTMIQHTTNTTHGSSGGVLLDESGSLVGVTSAGYDGTNLNFAIPISYVKDEIDKFNKN